MLSKFFIDRPIFATVLSVVIMLAGGISGFTLPIAQYPVISPPSVQVSITYPGASAQVVAETVAAPIEQWVNGVPGMLYMSSQMANDGTYSLQVTFDVGVDLNTALVMVQNRVTSAMPLLPTPVQNQGITIRKKTPDQLLMVNFISAVDVKTHDGKLIRGYIKEDSDETLVLKGAMGKVYRINKKDIEKAANDEYYKPLFDNIFLSNYALINIKDEVLRVPGVSDVLIMGERDYSIRVWLDPQKLASRNMTALDVNDAIVDQNIQAAAGQIGQPPMPRGQLSQLPLHTLGRLWDPQQFGDIVIKVSRRSGAKGVPTTASISPGGAVAYSTTGSGMQGPTIMSAGDGTTSAGGVVDSSGGSGSDASSSTGGPALGTSGLNPTGVTTMPSGPNGMPIGMTTGTGLVTFPKLSAGKNSSSAMLVKSTQSKPMPQEPPPDSPSVSIVQLRHVADIEMGATNYNIDCTFDGGPAVGVFAYQLPGTNALDVGRAIRAKMRELRRRFPDGLEFTIAYDTTPFISESIDEVFSTLRDAIILVAIVVLLFLQDWKAMILPMIDVPVSLIGTFAVMAVMGYSLNNISLFGLVLAIGIVVDDAIVVLENIERQMAKGLDTRTATIKAMEEITGPILAITMVLCAVFIPCAFISGVTGRFFRQFAVTIAASTIISAINALTMTPSRAVAIFKSQEGHHDQSHRREALPWWIFGLLGMVSLQYGPILTSVPLGLPEKTYLLEDKDAQMPPWQHLRYWLALHRDNMHPERIAAEPAPGTEELDVDLIEFEGVQESTIYWVISACYFLPGMLAGLVFGWFFIRPINAMLGTFFRGFNRVFDYFTEAYGRTVGLALRLSVIVLLGYVGLFVSTYVVAQRTPRGFVPQQDQGRLIGSVQLPDASSLARTKAVVRQVDEIARTVPGVSHTIGLAGISFIEQANGSNFGSLLIILKPFNERRRVAAQGADSIMKQLRKKWAEKIKDAKVDVSSSAPVPGISTAGGFKVMLEDRGSLDLQNLQSQTESFIKKLNQEVGEKSGRPMLSNVKTQFRSGIPQLYMDIDRIKVASLGVNLSDVTQTLETYLGSLYVNSFNEYGRYWQVTVQADEKFRSRVDDIKLLQVRNNQGQMVSLGTLLKIQEITGPLFIRRYNLYTAAPVTGAPLPGISSGEVITEVNKLASQQLKGSLSIEWTELTFLQIKESDTSIYVFALAVVFVFLALAALYESWTLPLAVILAVPLCVLGSYTGVLVRKYVFGHDASADIFVQIGLVVLVGLACKNSILIVEFAKELHAQGRSVAEAALESSKLRLRPILMTSFAFILGVAPLCIASGAGAEMRRSLGTAVFSGMLGVTLFGIFLTPVFFYVIQGLGELKFFANPVVQWTVSCLVGGGMGAVTGYSLAGLLGPHFIDSEWAIPLCGIAGILGVVAIRGLREKLKSR
jgi:multidrug efflux pump